jgi:hypothetical protein
MQIGSGKEYTGSDRFLNRLQKILPGLCNNVEGPGGSFGLENQLSLNASAFHQWPLCLNPRIIRDERSVCSSFDVNQPDTLSRCAHLKDQRHEIFNLGWVTSKRESVSIRDVI